MWVRCRRFLILVIFITMIVNVTPPIHTYANEINVSSYSAIVMDQKTGRVFFEKNAHEKRRIASITKIMTAILAIESNKMGETVTVSKKATRAEGSSVYLKPGEKIKLRDLVYGLMLRSGNDAAVAIAEHVGGSVDGFVFMMNEKAAQIGMENTHFANPHGLEDQDHYSSAYDMAILTKYAMENEEFRKISGTKVHYAPNPDSEWKREWTNKNRLLTELYKYSTGGKTGYTKKAHRTLVSTASKNGMDLIAVTLNTPSQTDWTEHIQMFEYVFDHYDYQVIVPDGTIDKITKKIYKKHAYIAHEYVYPINEDEKESFHVHYRLIKPKKEWKKNTDKIPEVIGKTEIYFHDELIHTMPIYYDHENKQEPSFFDSFKQLFSSVVGAKL
ncbi:D-alanyl-D-alanine carboxypeptidase family protein [Caldibacillus thermoamylovorans]|uniref:D-alanyl-D-alanine carboxypeptidase family protein n=1 Tax=Caldibacillus thermoamylovorans TaxID=35841 RepID=UPI00204112E5|nr:D-alanyl-D-alanine carboxypeptidase [Caldibacillus thermoamylovorans]